MTTFPIPRATTAVVFNDMINGNLRTGRADHDAAIDKSRIVESSVRFVAEVRKRGLPIIWVRVERRADRADVADPLTDEYIANQCQPKPPVTRDSVAAANIDELPVLDHDHVVLKPRIDPFIGTDLDLRLRTLGIDTILLGGYSTNMGVETIARTAHGLNYNVVLLEDCSYNVDDEAHRFSVTKIMPRVARVMGFREALRLLQ